MITASEFMTIFIYKGFDKTFGTCKDRYLNFNQYSGNRAS